MSNKSADEIEQYILNINSYNAKAEITINSNKNTNKYLVNEQYVKQENIYKKEILEPENIAGMLFIYDGNNLTIKNSKINLNQMYENYSDISSNNLTLKSFIEEYSKTDNKQKYEKDNSLILEIKTERTYSANKKLYIDKQTGKPTKIEIEDVTHKVLIYILYNEIEINNLQKNDVLAFDLNLKKQDV